MNHVPNYHNQLVLYFYYQLLLTDKLMEKDEICKQQEKTISSSNRRIEELQEIMDDRHEQCLSFQRALEVCTHL